ncbi:hypothetical protein B0H11DRAFT_1311819 [Mycena galericulata]|nr:hypothetical protein B0H11DRAFT_1311819 [Mycena galericulata]
MIFILHQYRRRTPWKQTYTIIEKLIFDTVETGAATTIVASVEAILFVLYPTNNLCQFPASMLRALYALVLVSSLNVRAWFEQTWRQRASLPRLTLKKSTGVGRIRSK